MEKDINKESKIFTFIKKNTIDFQRVFWWIHGKFYTCAQNKPRCRTHKECCRQNLKENLSYTCNLLKENGIKYWLDYGTLLGAVRDKNLIPYDTDTDISILAEDVDKLVALTSKIAADGRLLEHKEIHEYYRVCVSPVNGLHTDIFLWHKDKDMLRRTVYLERDSKKGRDFPENLITNLSSCEIDGIMYDAPKMAEDFCLFRYGNTWNTPIEYSSFVKS